MRASDCWNRNEECEGNGDRWDKLLGVPCVVSLRVIENERDRESKHNKVLTFQDEMIR